MDNLNNKKRILGRGNISLAVCILLITTALSATTVISFEPADLSQESLSYTFSFKEPNFKTLQADNSGYTNINMPGCLAIGKQAGEPAMPVKFIKLLLPPMKTVSDVTVTGSPIELDMGSRDLKQKPIIPHQNPVPIGYSEPEEFVIDTELYSSNNVYPSEIHGDYNIGYSRGYAIMDIALIPLQYIPNEGRIFLYPDITITIDFEETEEVNQFFRNNQDDKEWVEKLVYNPKLTESYNEEIQTFEYDGGLCDPEDDYDYVVITTTHEGLDYWETSEETPYNWESLLEKHEADDGLSCTLVTIEDIDDCNDYHNSDPLFDDLEAHIREFCKDAYQDWNTSYIFVGGDDEWIPAREMDSSYESNIDSDIYWSNLDNTFNDDEDTYWGEELDGGFDLYAEIFIGRITCDEPQDVSNWMTKSFYYADSGDPDYLENAAFFGGVLGWECQADDFIDYAAIKGTNNWLGPNPGDHGPYPSWLGFNYGFETWNSLNPGIQYNLSVAWTGEPPNPGWQGGSTNEAITEFRAAITADHVTLISGVAHANSQMSLDVQDSDWESEYHNTRPFFIHDWGCHCGDMDASDDGVLHSMLFHSDTELAFACIYNTCYGWGSFRDTNSSSSIQMKLFWDYFLDVTNNSGDTDNWQLGKGQAWSKDAMAPTVNWTYSSAPGSWRAVIQGCLLFGDPAQRLKTTNAVPEKPTQPDGPTEGITNIEYTFSSSTTDPEGDQIFYMFNWGDNTSSDWIGPYDSGVSGEASHAWTDPGDYEIKVKSKDVKGGSGDWSDPLAIHILQAPIVDIDIIRGGIFKVNAAIKNNGEVESTAVQWNITLDGGTIFLGKESSGEITSISPGGSVPITSGLILGFGKTQVTVTAEMAEGTDTRTQSGTMLLFFIYVNPGGSI
ncbi:hypothetical protein MBGDF03_00378 [Thermoplasmatales archaeon SCGC AB-540-F20]|nr:hypothetical protein MBGDF03_00378 [Thermoplasmatales archaeon SCGC AB-540-F20]